MSSTTLNKLIEEFSTLTVEDKEYAIEVIKKQLIEAKRETISKRANEAMVNRGKGKTQTGTVKKLYKDLDD